VEDREWVGEWVEEVLEVHAEVEVHVEVVEEVVVRERVPSIFTNKKMIYFVK
jgi:hypothetical protein